MRTILCNDCGQIITRYKSKCPACTRTNLLFFQDPDDPVMMARLKQIRKSKGSNGLYRLMVASMIFATVFIIGYTLEHPGEVEQVITEMGTEANTGVLQTASSNILPNQ